MKILNIPACCAALALTFGLVNPGWSQNAFVDGFRSTFVAGFVKGCLGSAKVDSYPKVKAIVEQMCECRGRGALQRMTGNELKFVNDRTLLEPIIKEEAKTCAEKLKADLQKAKAE